MTVENEILHLSMQNQFPNLLAFKGMWHCVQDGGRLRHISAPSHLSQCCQREQLITVKKAEMCFNCLVISGDSNAPEWQQWADHPVRKDYDILMDLGEGAFSQVRSELICCMMSWRTQNLQATCTRSRVLSPLPGSAGGPWAEQEGPKFVRSSKSGVPAKP